MRTLQAGLGNVDALQEAPDLLAQRPKVFCSTMLKDIVGVGVQLLFDVVGGPLVRGLTELFSTSWRAFQMPSGSLSSTFTIYSAA